MSSDSMDQPRNPCEVGGELGVWGVEEWESVGGNVPSLWGGESGSSRGWLCRIVLICVNARLKKNL